MLVTALLAVPRMTSARRVFRETRVVPKEADVLKAQVAEELARVAGYQTHWPRDDRLVLRRRQETRPLAPPAQLAFAAYAGERVELTFAAASDGTRVRIRGSTAADVGARIDAVLPAREPV